MPILPLPQFEEDLKVHREDVEAYERLKVPKTIVVRYGLMKMIGEFPWQSDAKPGCGSKIVVRTFRGTEIGEMLTSTCPNSGCSKSVSRQDMLRYIENSGGRDYPFATQGAALRVATLEDLNLQARLDQSRHELKMEARRIAESIGVTVKLVEAEPILGGERLTIYYHSEERLDLRRLHQELESSFSAKIDLRQVGARDEARLTADYERCGQYCCCKNFLKVLKPISMKSAKIQKATLDPLKISGRCGRLMCCLRYEDETYEDLRKRLPKRKVRVGTPEGDGIVIDGQILTQLVLVQLDSGEKQIAVPVEQLTEPESASGPPPVPRDDREARPDRRDSRPDRREPIDRRPDRLGGHPQSAPPAPRPEPERPLPSVRQPTPADRLAREFGEVPAGSSKAAHPPVESDDLSIDDIAGDDLGPPAPGDEMPRKKRRRRKRRRAGGEILPGTADTPPSADIPAAPPPATRPDGAPDAQRRRRRKRRRRPGPDGGPPSAQPPPQA